MLSFLLKLFPYVYFIHIYNTIRELVAQQLKGIKILVKTIKVKNKFFSFQNFSSCRLRIKLSASCNQPFRKVGFDKNISIRMIYKRYPKTIYFRIIKTGAT